LVFGYQCVMWLTNTVDKELWYCSIET